MEQVTPSQKGLKDERKKNLLLSALRVFCQKGYDGTTVDDIVKKAKCSHGLFYYYFKNKKQLFKEILEIKKSDNSENLKKALEGTSDYIEKLKIIINSMFYELKNDENYSYYFYFFISQCFNFKEKGKKPPKDKKELPPPPIVVFSELFDKGQKAGYFTTKHTPEECARLFISIIQGATLVYVISPKEFQSKRYILPNVDFIVDIFRKEEN